MCLTIPGRVLRVEGAGGPSPYAVVDFEGVERRVSLLYLPGIEAGEYLLSQAGFAIAKVPREEALEALELARRPLGTDAPNGQTVAR